MSSGLDQGLKQRVFERDRWRCRWCGRQRNWRGFDAHHIRYRRGSSDDTMDNLITLCRDCHDLVHGGRGAPPKDVCQEILRALVDTSGTTGMQLLRWRNTG